ncbi:hypothetical protein VYU27_008577 [Nannochloropsis oceanica]
MADGACAALKSSSFPRPPPPPALPIPTLEAALSKQQAIISVFMATMSVSPGLSTTCPAPLPAPLPFSSSAKGLMTDVEKESIRRPFMVGRNTTEGMCPLQDAASDAYYSFSSDDDDLQGDGYDDDGDPMVQELKENRIQQRDQRDPEKSLTTRITIDKDKTGEGLSGILVEANKKCTDFHHLLKEIEQDRKEIDGLTIQIKDLLQIMRTI